MSPSQKACTYPQVNPKVQTSSCFPAIWLFCNGFTTGMPGTFKYMMMMMMMMNCSCGMVDRRKAFSLISSRNHCQRFSPSRISDTPRAGFEPAQTLSSGLVEWSCAVAVTTTPRRTGKYTCQSLFFNKVTLAQVC